MAYNQQFCYAQACRGTHIHMYVVDVACCQTRSLWAIQGVKRLIKRNLQHLCNTHTYTHTHLAQLLAHPIVRLQFSCSAIRFHAYPSIHPSTQPFIHIQFHQTKHKAKSGKWLSKMHISRFPFHAIRCSRINFLFCAFCAAAHLFLLLFSDITPSLASRRRHSCQSTIIMIIILFMLAARTITHTYIQTYVQLCFHPTHILMDLN